MKEKIFINARIVDPSQKMDEVGSLILDKEGKVKAIGKNVKKTDVSGEAEIIDVNENILIPLLILLMKYLQTVLVMVLAMLKLKLYQRMPIKSQILTQKKILEAMLIN